MEWNYPSPYRVFAAPYYLGTTNGDPEATGSAALIGAHCQAEADTDTQQQTATVRAAERSKATYTMKILNPKRKKEFTVRKLRCEGKFGNLRELRLKLLEQFQESLPDRLSFNVGYYKPGRGSAKVYLVEDDEMYGLFGANQEVQLWCDGVASDEEPEQPGTSAGKKRKSETDPSVTT